MKKLVAMLVMVVLVHHVMAAKQNYSLYNGTHDYTNLSGTTALKYTASDWRYNDTYSGQQRGWAQVYFTTASLSEVKSMGYESVAVQFLGTDIDTDQKKNLDDPKNFVNNPNYSGHDVYNIVDYGIYLYDPKTKQMGDLMSVKDYRNYFDIGADKNFGVYYVDKNGNICTTTGNWTGNFDTNSHKIITYDENDNQVPTTTETRFMCLIGQQWAGYQTDHWEFMLQTSLDHPYYPVNPNDFGDDVSVDNPVVHGNGQPLPGTLATLLIGGLCAGSLRKRNKK